VGAERKNALDADRGALHQAATNDQPAPPPVISLPLVDGSEFGITAEQAEEWSSAYPAVDVPQQLRQMRQWLLANPRRRKTRRGILAFVVSWLAREQDRGARVATGTHGMSVRPMTYGEIEAERKRRFYEANAGRRIDSGDVIDADDDRIDRLFGLPRLQGA
ncbi:MAG: hypothetical protein N2690_12910, partial [Rhodocyclaceae bacterium]|nr:hypothetical protein [Rhodocyclaceae bacterium]